MNTSIKEVSRIVRRSPTELKYLFKSPNEDKKRLTKLISNLVPYRVGIEFECFGSVGSYLWPSLFSSNNHDDNPSFNKPLNTKIKNRLRLCDFSEDTHNYKLDFDDGPTYHEDGELGEIRQTDYALNEVRISIPGYKGLISLYKTLDLFKKCLEIPSEKGGIHIHIDAQFQNSKNEDDILKFFSNDQIQSRILRIFEGYKGTYNKRGVNTAKKRYVRVRTQYNTIEFRIGKLNFEYKTLIRWIIELSKLVSECKVYVSPKSKKINELESERDNVHVEDITRHVLEDLVSRAFRYGAPVDAVRDIIESERTEPDMISELTSLINYLNDSNRSYRSARGTTLSNSYSYNDYVTYNSNSGANLW